MDYATPKRNYGHLVLITLLAILVLATLVASFVGPLGSIPLTRHAQNAHQGQAINASTLIDDISNNGCKEVQIWDCPDATMKILCKKGRNLWGGLIVGINQSGDFHVITGYGAREAYWENVIKPCIYTGSVWLP